MNTKCLNNRCLCLLKAFPVPKDLGWFPNSASNSIFFRSLASMNHGSMTPQLGNWVTVPARIGFAKCCYCLSAWPWLPPTLAISTGCRWPKRKVIWPYLAGFHDNSRDHFQDLGCQSLDSGFVLLDLLLPSFTLILIYTAIHNIVVWLVPFSVRAMQVHSSDLT